MLKAGISEIYKKFYKFAGGRGFSRLPFVRALNNYVLFKLKPAEVIVDGDRIILDKFDALRLSINKNYEPEIKRLVKEKIEKGDTALDIGANIGYYTLLFAKLAGNQGRVFAFEPEPNNFQLLKKNIEYNNYSSVTLEPLAVSDRSKRMRLCLNKNNQADNRLVDSSMPNSIDVGATSLDDYFKDYSGKIDFVKIDAQGAEAAIIKGMDGILRKNKDIKLLVEFWPFGLKYCGSNADLFLKLLSGYGFDFYEISLADIQPVRTSAKALLDTYTEEKQNFTNLFCLRA
ncbi:MAG: FkbM family methyltransferase [Candidatus Omnitrophica bacterium]|nr:FkbM family methyltransferase [Candidatus Omnitrophota bacterium]